MGPQDVKIAYIAGAMIKSIGSRRNYIRSVQTEVGQTTVGTVASVDPVTRSVVVNNAAGYSETVYLQNRYMTKGDAVSGVGGRAL